MIESSPSRQRRPPCKTNKEVSDEAADAAALTYLLTYSVYIHLLPCNVNAMTRMAAAKWCAETWMWCWDVCSEITTDSGSVYSLSGRKHFGLC